MPQRVCMLASEIECSFRVSILPVCNWCMNFMVLSSPSINRIIRLTKLNVRTLKQIKKTEKSIIQKWAISNWGRSLHSGFWVSGMCISFLKLSVRHNPVLPANNFSTFSLIIIIRRTSRSSGTIAFIIIIERERGRFCCS